MADLPRPDYARVVDESPVPLVLLTPDLRVLHANRARLAVTGTALADALGRPLGEAFGAGDPAHAAADSWPDLLACLHRVRETGRAEVLPALRHTGPGATQRWWSLSNAAVLDGAGRVALLVHQAVDVTGLVAGGPAADGASEGPEHDTEDGRRAGRRQRRAGRHLTALAEAASTLAAADTLDDLLTRLGRHAPIVTGAEAALVALADEDGGDLTVVRVGTQVPPTRLAGLAATSDQAPAVAATGHRVLLPAGAPAGDPPDPGVGRPTAAPPDAGVPGMRSWAALPLQAGERTYGSLTLGWRQAQRFDDEQLAVLEALAVQCAQAVGRVVGLEAERRRARATRSLSEALQRSLLTDPPQPDDLEIAVRYRPAAQEAQVGGDWYDAFLLPDGATTIVIGDVTGHDRNAAAAMGQLRNVLRGVSHALLQPPAAILGALDRAMHDLGITGLATAVLARVEQTPEQAAAGRRNLRWSNAGHPPPLLVEPDGSVHLLSRQTNLLLGLLPDAHREDHEVQLRPGATVVLYTDGLVETRSGGLDAGLDRLVAAAAGLHAMPLTEACEALVGRLAPEADDDVALVALRTHPAGTRPAP